MLLKILLLSTLTLYAYLYDSNSKYNDFILSKEMIQQATLKPTNIFSDATPFTVFIQKLGPPLAEAKNLISDSNDNFFALAYKTFDNIEIAGARKIKKILGPTGNSFYDAMYLAWTSHGELILSPDDFWVQIAIEASHIVNKNSEKTRKLSVNSEEVKTLYVRTSNEEPFSNWKNPQYRWDVIMSEMSTLIQKSTKNDFAKPFLMPFSTTGFIENAVSEMALINSCQTNFKYVKYVHLEFYGGLKAVHYLGNKIDWELLVTKAKLLNTYAVEAKLDELKRYISKLIPTLIHLRDGVEGKLNLKFWNSIFVNNYKVKETYTHPLPENYRLDGWANHFLNDHIKSLRDVKTRYLTAPINLLDNVGKKNETIIMMGGFSGILIDYNMYRPVMTIGMSDKCDRVKQLAKQEIEVNI